MGRIFMIGIDGGSWDIVKPLAERGDLPNLERLMREGAWGVLKSTFPPVTCPAWLTFSTGMRPSRLGIYGFFELARGTNRLRYHTAKDQPFKEFWDLLMLKDISSGIINDPLLYPRKKHLGYIVPGFITPQDEFRTYPAELIQELDRAAGGYEVDQEAGDVVRDDELIRGCERVIKKRAESISYLIDAHPTDYFLGVFTSTDRISHRFFNHMMLGNDSDRERGMSFISCIYKMVDEGIGTVMEKAGEDDHIIVMSDHGFAARPWNLHVNQYLVDAGLQKVKVTGALENVGVTKRRLKGFLSRFEAVKKAYRASPRWLRDLIPAGENIYGESYIHDLIDMGRVDWEKTRAVCLGETIYLNGIERPEGVLEAGEAKKVSRMIKEDLESIRDPEGNDGQVEVLSPEDIYGEERLVNPPDLMLVGKGRWELVSTLARDGETFTPSKRSGHSVDGMFIHRHPWARPGEIKGRLGIEDIAPLVLQIYDLPVPAEMDGKVHKDIYEEGTPLSREERRIAGIAGDVDAEMERIRRRVNALRNKDRL
jgi:predicted AlkP superfamily phosphohydrolase/phosphomutase